MALDLNDKTANGNTLTNSGGVEVTSSLPFAASTKAVQLTAASSQYLRASDSASLSHTGNFTIEFWVKFTTLPASAAAMALVTKFGASGNWSYFIDLLNTGGNYFIRTDISGSGSDLDDHQVTAGTMSTGTWYHFAVVFTAASHKIEVFKDGSSQGTDTTGTITSVKDGNTSVSLGTTDNAGSNINYLNGYLDDVRIWNVARTGTEINNNKSLHLAGNESGLVAYWPLETLGSPSPSLSPSVSVSLSPSVSASLSQSLTPSVSVSLSPSVSVSRSPSVSVSLSPSASQSPSSSVSSSPSPSVEPGSASPSLSNSLSTSLSPSASVSESRSISLSPSASVSPSSSVSLSESKSESVSNSRSISPSHSASDSRSASLSYSISDSPSPSVSESLYSREAKIALPTDKSDLTTMYTTREEYDVFANDDVFVDLTGVTGKYLIHQFKKLNNNRVDRIRFRVDLKSTIAPSDKTVYLAIWNGQTSSWLVVDSNSIREANTEFSLTGDVSDTSYFDFNNEAAIRVYQQNTTGSNQTLSIDMVRMDFLIRYRDKFESRPIQYRSKYLDKNGR